MGLASRRAAKSFGSNMMDNKEVGVRFAIVKKEGFEIPLPMDYKKLADRMGDPRTDETTGDQLVENKTETKGGLAVWASKTSVGRSIKHASDINTQTQTSCAEAEKICEWLY